MSTPFFHDVTFTLNLHTNPNLNIIYKYKCKTQIHSHKVFGRDQQHTIFLIHSQLKHNPHNQIFIHKWPHTEAICPAQSQISHSHIIFWVAIRSAQLSYFSQLIFQLWPLLRLRLLRQSAQLSLKIYVQWRLSAQVSPTITHIPHTYIQ